MTVKYEITIGELKALLELIQELARSSGLSEVITKSLMKKLNEKHFR